MRVRVKIGEILARRLRSGGGIGTTSCPLVPIIIGTQFIESSCPDREEGDRDRKERQERQQRHLRRVTWPPPGRILPRLCGQGRCLPTSQFGSWRAPKREREGEGKQCTGTGR